MNRAALSDSAHRRHAVAAPVGRVECVSCPAGSPHQRPGRVLDLGSGHGAWLLELMAAREGLTGVGVDLPLPDGLAQTTQDG